MKTLMINGTRYPIVESLGFNQEVGANAWIVITLAGEKMAVGHRSNAQFWTPRDRVAPLVAGLARMEKLRREAEEETENP